MREIEREGGKQTETEADAEKLSITYYDCYPCFPIRLNTEHH